MVKVRTIQRGNSKTLEEGRWKSFYFNTYYKIIKVMWYWYKNRQISQLNRTQYSEIILCVYICKVYLQGCQDTQKGKDRLNCFDSQILPAIVHTNTWFPGAVSLPWLTESRQLIQIGPKQSLLPTTLRPHLQPVGEKPCPGQWPGEPPHKCHVTGPWGDGI